MSMIFHCRWNDTNITSLYDLVTFDNLEKTSENFKYYGYEFGPEFIPILHSIEDVRKKRLRHDILSILKKFIFFAQDEAIVNEYSPNERFIMDNYGDQIPRLLQKVGKLNGSKAYRSRGVSYWCCFR